jgi:hypothetical protein
VNPSFLIEPTIKNHTGQSTLFIEISIQGVSYIVLHNDTDCTALGIYHFPEDTAHDAAAVLLKLIVSTQKLLQADFKKINIVYSYPTALYIPHQFFDHATFKKMFELVHGEIGDELLLKTDFMYRQQLHNVYALPKQVDAVVSYLFSADFCTHQYSLLPNAFKQEGSHLYCIVGIHYFTVLCMKAGKLQVVQTFGYKVAEDFSYHLLSICSSFELELHDTTVTVSGMIDENSILYKELYKYFVHIQFAPLPDKFSYPEAIDQYPAHYFSHLFLLASCV